MIRRAATATFLVALALGLSSQTGAAPTQINSCQSLLAGSYVLTANLPSSGDCLVVGANFVSIDLDGFKITATSPGTGRGITDGGEARLGIAVRGGTVENFWKGVDLEHTTGAVVEEMRVFGSADTGMRVGGDSLVRGNVAHGNAIGISAGANSLVTGNTASANRLGVSVFHGDTVTENTASQNSVTGISVIAESLVSNNTASDNGTDGLVIDSCASGPSNVVANTALGNGLNNLNTFGVSGCQFVDNLN